MVDAQKLAGEFGARSTVGAVKRAEQSYMVALAGMVAAMLVTLVALWFYFRRAVLAPMQTAVGFAGRIASGDLTARIQAKSEDEAGQLLRSLEKMQASLGGVVAQVRSSADAVATASARWPPERPIYPSAPKSRLQASKRPRPAWRSSRAR
jgi:methyl-accepting chemotaxis protein